MINTKNINNTFNVKKIDLVFGRYVEHTTMANAMNNNVARTKTSDPRVRRVIKTLGSIGISFLLRYQSQDYEINMLTVDSKGRLFHIEGDEQVMTSRLLKTITQLNTVRWINYLYFNDANGRRINFKKYMCKHHKCSFS